MDLNTIYTPVKDGLTEVEKTLKSVADVEIPLLAELLAYLLQNGGKRIRPALTLVSGKFGDYNLEMLKPMAAGLEMLHVATLVHDDIVDHSATRHGKPSISSAWGEASALLLGDYLFARAGQLVASTGVLRVVRLFSQTLMTISSGELAQISILFDQKKARDHYFNWVSAKTACLFSTCTESGAVLGNCPEETISALKEYGENFGIAFQIVDDILDFTGQEARMGKPVGSDLMEGAVTLPSILFAEMNTDDNLLKNVIEKHDIDSVSTIIEKIRSSTVLGDCMEIASEHTNKACKAIEKLPDNDVHQSLVELSKFILERNK